jgi:hypothetical protein
MINLLRRFSRTAPMCRLLSAVTLGDIENRAKPHRLVNMPKMLANLTAAGKWERQALDIL